jgi:hypothetical protein
VTVRALLAALAVMAAVAVRPGTDGGSPDGGSPDTGARDAGAPDADQELIDHLDEIEQLELLRNLELFDPGK